MADRLGHCSAALQENVFQVLESGDSGMAGMIRRRVVGDLQRQQYFRGIALLAAQCECTPQQKRQGTGSTRRGLMGPAQRGHIVCIAVLI